MADDQDGGDDAAPAGGSAPIPSASAAPPPQGAAPPGGPQGGGGTLAPQGAPGAQAISALGQQAMARAKLKLVVHTLHRDISPAFEVNSEEGHAIRKALGALSKFGGGGKDDGDKNSAMAALMQRAMAARAAGGGGAGPGGPGQMPQPNRGPIPSMAGAAQ